MMCCWGLTRTSNMASRISENCSWGKPRPEWFANLSITEADSPLKVLLLPGPEFWRSGCVCRRPEVCGAARPFWGSPLEAQRRRPRPRRGCTPLHTLRRDKGRAQMSDCGQHALPVLFITDLRLCGCISRWWTLRRDECHHFSGLKLNYNLSWWKHCE